jgi:hypothetical protein
VTFAPNAAGNEGPRARRFTEPLRELSVFALLAGNAVFLLIGVTRLFVVIDRWASDFGLRCSEVFPMFVGPYALGLPILAVLLATHVEPMVHRTRLVLLVAIAEYGVSAFFGALTFLGAFAFDLRSPRAVIEAVLLRGVWLGFLVLGGMVLYRLWRGLFPPPPPRSPVYGGGYAPTTYGKPYPGQPMYPQPGAPTSPDAQAAGDQSAAAAWPEVPPPPMPAPITIEPDPTTRLTPVAAEPTTPAHPATPVSGEPAAGRADVRARNERGGGEAGADDATTVLPTQPQPPDTGGDATQVVPLPSGEPPTEETSRA